eukprot:3249647-Rhodomonas_salina.1
MDNYPDQVRPSPSSCLLALPSLSSFPPPLHLLLLADSALACADGGRDLLRHALPVRAEPARRVPPDAADPRREVPRDDLHARQLPRGQGPRRRAAQVARDPARGVQCQTQPCRRELQRGERGEQEGRGGREGGGPVAAGVRRVEAGGGDRGWVAAEGGPGVLRGADEDAGEVRGRGLDRGDGQRVRAPLNPRAHTPSHTCSALVGFCKPSRRRGEEGWRRGQGKGGFGTRGEGWGGVGRELVSGGGVERELV